MKIGTVTDMHLTIKDVKPTIEKLEEISSQFEREDVEKVFFLGDVIHENENKSKLKDVLGDVQSIFSNFTTYYTPGNHDVISFTLDEIGGFFDYSGVQVVYETPKKSVIMVDTSSEALHQNMGFIGEESLELIESEMNRKDEVVVLTHYPLQHTTAHCEVFSTFQEEAFPINKQEIYHINERTSGEIKNVVCGHLHPVRTEFVIGEPDRIPMTIVEPLINFNIESRSLVSHHNKSLDPSDLILEI